jgi:thiol:disulfide interchange protein DsbA
MVARFRQMPDTRLTTARSAGDGGSGPIELATNFGADDVLNGFYDRLNRRRRQFPGSDKMKRLLAVFCALAAVIFTTGAQAADKWVAGKHYVQITPALHTSVPAGKVEVAELFSYGCPYCYQILPVMNKMKAQLPANAQLVYVPASFLPREAWPMYQRAFYAAQALGIVDKTHDAMFEAVWKTGELSYTDASTRQIKKTLPTIEDAARFYEKAAGVKQADFLAAAKSFGVEVKMKNADAFVNGSQELSTPMFVVNGKYRLNAETAGSYEAVIEVVKFLVAKESAETKGAMTKTSTSGK